MADPLQFDLVSPERLLMSEKVSQIVVPGADGYFTVLANHAPFMSTLKPGLLEITPEEGAIQKVFVRGGFADVTPKGLTVLAEQAVPLEDVDAELLAAEIRDAEEDLADAGDDEDAKTLLAKRLNDLQDLQGSIDQ